MQPDNFAAHPTAAQLHAGVPDAITALKFDRGELTLEVAAPLIVAACASLKASGFERLSTVTAVDRYPAEPRFEVVYHVHSVSRNERLRLKCRVAGRDPRITSVYRVWRSADWYEREVFDLFGIQFEGHPDLRRIMLPDNWEGHPLRKDYPITGNRV